MQTRFFFIHIVKSLRSARGVLWVLWQHHSPVRIHFACKQACQRLCSEFRAFDNWTDVKVISETHQEALVR